METNEAIRLLIAHGQDEALASVISTPGFDDDLVGKAYLEHRRRNSDATEVDSKGMTPMHASSSFRKTLIDAGYVPSIRKGIYDEALKSLGEALRQPGDTDAKAYVRGLETSQGMALHALYKVAAPDDPPQDVVEQPKPKGPANIELQIEASRLRRENPRLTHAQAVTAVYTSPEHRELRDRVKREDLAGVPRTPAGQTIVGRNPNWNADVRATMARTR